MTCRLWVGTTRAFVLNRHRRRRGGRLTAPPLLGVTSRPRWLSRVDGPRARLRAQPFPLQAAPPKFGGSGLSLLSGRLDGSRVIQAQGASRTMIHIAAAVLPKNP